VVAPAETFEVPAHDPAALDAGPYAASPFGGERLKGVVRLTLVAGWPVHEGPGSAAARSAGAGGRR
jgi:hypothetical protein